MLSGEQRRRGYDDKGFCSVRRHVDVEKGDIVVTSAAILAKCFFRDWFSSEDERAPRIFQYFCLTAFESSIEQCVINLSLSLEEH